MSTGEDTRQRALLRRQQLLDRYGGTLDLLADIYRDNDWRRIEDPTTGSQYVTFTRFVSSELKVSAAYARRTAQAIRELVLPLRDKAGADAAAAVTLTDMENLGTEGARRLIAELEPANSRDDGGEPLDVQELVRARIVQIASSRDSEPVAQAFDESVVSVTAAAVPTARSSHVEAVRPAPWAGRSTSAVGDERRDREVAQCGDVFGAVLDEILTADPAVAARALAGRESDLSRAAVALTRIRARVLASTTAPA